MKTTRLKILRFMGCDSVRYGSHERYLVKFVKAAARCGHSVTIVYDSPPQITEYREDILNAGGQFFYLRLRNSFDLTFFVKLSRLIRAHNINVIHSYFTPSCHYVMLYAWLTGIRKRFRTSANMPLTTHSGIRNISSLFKWQFGLKQRFYSTFPKRILVLSEVMKEEFVNLGISSEKLVVIYGGVDSNHFKPSDNGARKEIKEEFGLSQDEKLIGYLGRLVPIKGLETLIKAAQLIKISQPNARLLIVGEGPLKSILIEMARRLEVADMVIFTGRRNDAHRILSALDVFVLPSLSEGLSNALMEAMAMRLPVVASSIPPNKELIQDRYNGVLFSPRDTEKLASSIVELINNRRFAIKLGNHAREVIEEKYSMLRRVNAELDLYENTL